MIVYLYFKDKNKILKIVKKCIVSWKTYLKTHNFFSIANMPHFFQIHFNRVKSWSSWSSKTINLCWLTIFSLMGVVVTKLLTVCWFNDANIDSSVLVLIDLVATFGLEETFLLYWWSLTRIDVSILWD